MKVEISHISKTLRGAKVLDDVSLTLEGGNIYGLMGENGSGKTMLMRTVCGLVRPDRGTVTFDGQDRKTAKPVLGVMIENTALYALGMKQRLLLAQAIMEKPQVLLLDEPTNAIDAEGVALTHEIMRQEADRGAVVLLASHISADIHDLCCKVYRMDRGRLEDRV